MSSWEYSPRVQSTRTVANAGADARSLFIRQTYMHVAGAILGFALLEYILLQLPFTTRLITMMVGSRFSWLAVLGLFMGVSYVADRWAQSDTSRGMQYLGLSLYVVAEAIIFLPLLYVAARVAHPNVLPSAALLTLTLFGGLTATVFLTKKDFSFLRGALTIGFFVALGVIVASAIFGFNLGVIFSGAMILLAGGSILYTTSNVLHHYRTDQYVAASLALFAGIALLFWYILRLLLSLSRD
ncbi:MAG: Bax inhibitor-1/YccA family protein [Myxococcales bacterium]|nr:Bax inhibitor-1/YccA family protein [Myxococcales bacterium]